MDVEGDNSLRSRDAVLGQIRGEHREIQALLGLVVIEPSTVVRDYLRTRVCRLVRLHCTLEASLIVPIVAEAAVNPQLLEHAGAAYARILRTINELTAAEVGDRLQTLVAELTAQMDEHIDAAESESGFLSQAERFGLDWAAIEATLARRRSELREQESF